MRFLIIILSTVSVLLSAGCAKMPSPEARAAADYGAPPPENYEKIIKGAFSSVLLDSKHRVYSFEKPVRGYTQNNHRLGVPKQYGWLVCGTVNSKYGMGGYTPYSGPVPFFAMFKNGEISTLLMGEKPGEEEESPKSLNFHIRKACSSGI